MCGAAPAATTSASTSSASRRERWLRRRVDGALALGPHERQRVADRRDDLGAVGDDALASPSMAATWRPEAAGPAADGDDRRSARAAGSTHQRATRASHDRLADAASIRRATSSPSQAAVAARRRRTRPAPPPGRRGVVAGLRRCPSALAAQVSVRATPCRRRGAARGSRPGRRHAARSISTVAPGEVGRRR